MTAFTELEAIAGQPEDPDLYARADALFHHILLPFLNEHPHAQRLVLASLVSVWRDLTPSECRDDEMTKFFQDIVRMGQTMDVVSRGGASSSLRR